MNENFNEDVMRAVSNEYRRKMLELLYFNGDLEYAELMKRVGFRLGESSKFAYHLNKLEKAGLVTKKLNGKYTLTGDGKRIVRILLDENLKDVDPITEFANNVDIDLYATASIIVFLGLFLLIFNAILLVMALLGIPSTVEIMGQKYIKPINTVIPLFFLLAGGSLTLLSLCLFKKSGKKYSLLEKIVLQKYLFLLLIKKGNIGKYVGLLTASIIIAVLSSILPFII